MKILSDVMELIGLALDTVCSLPDAEYMDQFLLETRTEVAAEEKFSKVGGGCRTTL